MSIVVTTKVAVMYVYAGVQYSSEADMDAGVLATKHILDNTPTAWCVVKRVTLDADDNVYVPETTLSDSEILSLDPVGVYQVSSELNGDNWFRLSADEAAERVQLERTVWANAKEVNSIYTGRLDNYLNNTTDSPLYGTTQDIFILESGPVAPTNADMSGYV